MSSIMRRGVVGVLTLLGLAGRASAQHSPDSTTRPDSAFRAMQERGRMAMGVDQYTSAHRFEALADGGRIELQRNSDDSADVEQIRRHLRAIAAAFRAGDFSTPMMVHNQVVPGTVVMAAKRERIRYDFHQLPRGGEVRIVSTDPDAIAAIHEFLAFQQQEHHTMH